MQNEQPQQPVEQPVEVPKPKRLHKPKCPIIINQNTPKKK